MTTTDPSTDSSVELNAKTGVTVRIPITLRSSTGGADEIIVASGTALEVLQAVEVRCPGLMVRLLDEVGGIRRFINLYVGDDDIRFEPQGADAPPNAPGVLKKEPLSTPVEAGDIFSIIPAVAGG